MSDTDSEKIYDLIVVGGGMVGSALACAAAEAGFEVCVIEAAEPQVQWPADEVDLRVSALSRSSQRILENLGVWERMRELRVSPYTDMHVWETGGEGRFARVEKLLPPTEGAIHFSAAEIGQPNLGHIVENRVTQLALWEHAERLARVTRLCPARIGGLEIGKEPGLVLQDGRHLRSRLIVGADGRDSLVRQLADIGTKGWDYDQHAVVATIRPELHHRFTAWQRFMSTGPLAFLPIDDGRCSIVWSTTPEHAEELLAMGDGAFCQALSVASAGVVGEILQTGLRAAFPLRLGHAETYIRIGLALVGDAAHAIHPLAGQGVNLGFLDAATLVEVLIQARDAGRSIGAPSTLRRYERARKGANLEMLGAMDLFKRLFSNDLPPLRLSRKLGLILADHAGPMKHLMIKRAMGLVGELPALAR